MNLYSAQCYTLTLYWTHKNRSFLLHIISSTRCLPVLPFRRHLCDPTVSPTMLTRLLRKVKLIDIVSQYPEYTKSLPKVNLEIKTIVLSKTDPYRKIYKNSPTTQLFRQSCSKSDKPTRHVYPVGGAHYPDRVDGYDMETTGLCARLRLKIWGQQNLGVRWGSLSVA